MTNPEKRERFKALAEKRVVKAIKALRLIGNLANRGNYSFTDEDVEKILTSLEAELTSLRKKFQDPGQPESIDFRL